MDEEQNKGVETAGKQAEEKKQNQGNKKNPAQKVQSAKKAAKVISKLKNIAVLGPAIGILAIIVLIIGLLAFFFTMPGLFLENIKETAKNLWISFLNVFDGSSSVDRTITDEQMIDLAQRIDSMGYDISAYGFADVLEENENGAPTKIGANTDGKNYIRTYLIANESTYSIANWSVGGAASAYFENLKNLFLDPFNMDAQASDYSQGLIAFVQNDLGNILMYFTSFDASIDREKEALVIQQSGLGKLFFGTFYFSLSDWTSRYGKPIELLLSLHLATMMPDLSYDIVSQFNTKVNLKSTPIWTTFVVEYYKNDGEVITTEDILIAKEYKDGEERIKKRKETIYENINKLEERAAETESETALESIYDRIDSYYEELDEYDKMKAKYDDIMDDLESSEGGDTEASAGDIFDKLAELAETGKRGDHTYWPRIDNVQEHWFYEPIDFSDAYDWSFTSTISMNYTPEDENDALTNIQNKLNLEATLINMIIQVKEPVAKGPNQKIKDIFLNNEYYRYDGTEARVQAIENARALDSGKSQYLYKGEWYDTVERTVNKEPVNFYTSMTMPDGTEIKSTKNALSAFSILEGMHTEASEQIYRNLQELLIELGYFTEEDFAKPSTQVLEWILPGHTPEKWAIRMPNEYGAFIRSEANMKSGFEAGEKVIAPADATVEEVGADYIKLKLKAIDDETIKALQEKLGEDSNVVLDPNCILDMEFLVQGISVSQGIGQEVKRGEEIGTTTNEDIHIIMYNIDKSIVDNVEDYMEPNYDSYSGVSAGQWFDPDYEININQTHKEVYEKLKSYNLTDEGIFTVMGIMQAESGFDVSIDNILPDGSSDGGHGLLQWTGGRRTNLENFCRNNGYEVDSVEGQLEFFIYELEKSYSKENGYKYPVYETLMTSNNMEECMEMFFSHAEAGYNIPISDTYIYNHNFDITTQELYDMRLTYAVAFAKKQKELEE